MSEPNDIVVAAVQMTCRLGKRSANLARAEELLAEVEGKAQMACLPETINTGYNLEALGDSLFSLAETVPGPTTEHLSRVARRLNLALVAGIVEREPEVDGLIYDTAVLIDREGEVVARYRKTHLYPAENAYFRPGNRIDVIRLAGLKVGVAICFEHAFPHIFTTLSLRGAQVVLNPSAVPLGYGYLQDVRIPARAQDNQIFVVAVNHVGREGNVTYCGRSQIANPRGEVVALAADNAEGVVTARLPLDLIWNQRRQEPIFRGFRPELYEPRA